MDEYFLLSSMWRDVARTHLITIKKKLSVVEIGLVLKI